MGFVHLHVHSQFSLLDGTASPAALAERAAAAGMSALALTDASNLFGAVGFYKACKEAGVRAIIGAELDVQPEGLDTVSPEREEGGYKIVVLVENEAGYHSLCRLVTAAIFDGTAYKPRIDLTLLERHRDGLLVLAGGRRGPLGCHGPEASGDARAEVARLASAVGPERLFLELVDHGLDGEHRLNGLTREVAASEGLPLVVTNGVHYLDAEDAPVHEVLNAIATGHSLSSPDRMRSPTDQAYFKTEAEMLALFPGEEDAIARAGEIAARCDFHFTFGEYHFPAAIPPDFVAGDNATQPDTDDNWAFFYRAYPPPRAYDLPDPEVAIPPRPAGAGHLAGYFEWYASRGLRLRIAHIPEDRHPAYWDRLKVELDIINGMGFPAYLLIVAEFINWSKDMKIPVGPGRGSAAGSLVAWAMRITDIDPLQFDLLFERFLNPERVSMPDIDVDFCQDRREEVIEHVREKYGSPLVSQIITYGKLKAKAAIRDVARTLDLTFNESDRISKLVPDTLGISLADAIDQVPQLQAMRDGDPKVRRVLDLALAVENGVRQTGVHAAGVVIADRPLVEYAPLYRDEPGGGPVVQYDMKSAEGIGLIKFDFLGLKTLDQIRDAVLAIERNHGVSVDLAQIPLDDAATYRLLQAGDSLGVFQLESSGMRDLLMRLRPNVIDDMVALVALYRPGPLSSGMTDDFVIRKHDPSKIDYPLPILEPILKPTYGTIVYQEQVMKIAQVMGGFSLGGADLLRRAMGKKSAEVMEKQRALFVDGSVANGIDAQKASDIFDLLAKFAAYGFNKSHSAAYGYISYQTAWLKAHYRPEYMAALMSIEAGNTDKVLAYIDDCKHLGGIRIEPVCVNRSERAFHVPNPTSMDATPAIHFGLAAVKNVGGGAVDAILETRRQEGGRFEDAFHFFRTIDHKRVNKRVIENLIKAGALDFGGVPRRALFEGLEDVIRAGQRVQQDKAVGQASLFAALTPTHQPAAHRFPDVPEWPLSERLGYERDVLGMYLSGHPMEGLQGDVVSHATHSIGVALTLPDKAEVRLVGLPSEVRINRTRRGDRMARVKLDDVNESIWAVFFPDAWATAKKTVEAGEVIRVAGTLKMRDGDIQLVAENALRLVDVRSQVHKTATLRVTAEELRGARLIQLKALLEKQSGSTETRLKVRLGDLEAELALPQLPVEPGVALEEAAESLFRRRGVVTFK